MAGNFGTEIDRENDFRLFYIPSRIVVDYCVNRRRAAVAAQAQIEWYVQRRTTKKNTADPATSRRTKNAY
jgi:hypothetical protein